MSYFISWLCPALRNLQKNKAMYSVIPTFHEMKWTSKNVSEVCHTVLLRTEVIEMKHKKQDTGAQALGC
jgi:hypothetical protein